MRSGPKEPGAGGSGHIRLAHPEAESTPGQTKIFRDGSERGARWLTEQRRFGKAIPQRIRPRTGSALIRRHATGSASSAAAYRRHTTMNICRAGSVRRLRTFCCISWTGLFTRMARRNMFILISKMPALFSMSRTGPFAALSRIWSIFMLSAGIRIICSC